MVDIDIGQFLRSGYLGEFLKRNDVIIKDPKRFTSIKITGGKKIEMGEYGLLSGEELKSFKHQVGAMAETLRDSTTWGQLITSGIEKKRVFDLGEQLVYWTKLIYPKPGDKWVHCMSCRCVRPISDTVQYDSKSKFAYCFECSKCSKTAFHQRTQWFAEMLQSGKMLDDIPFEEMEVGVFDVTRQFAQQAGLSFEVQDPTAQTQMTSAHQSFVEALSSEIEDEMVQALDKVEKDLKQIQQDMKEVDELFEEPENKVVVGLLLSMLIVCCRKMNFVKECLRSLFQIIQWMCACSAVIQVNDIDPKKRKSVSGFTARRCTNESPRPTARDLRAKLRS